MVFGLSDDFGNKPFHLIHNIAIKSAHNIIKPDKIFLYCKYEPENNKYWNEIKSIVEIVKVEPVSEIFGNQIEHCAHKTDILRLEKLIEIGGIYLDCDTICINSFDNLLNNNFLSLSVLITCNAITASIQNNRVGITNIILGALNLLYNGNTFNKVPVNPSKYLPQLINRVSIIAASIQPRCFLSIRKNPTNAKKQIIAPAYGGPEVPPVPPQ